MRHLPTEPLAVSALPTVTGRDEYEAARARLLVKEKAHSRAGEFLALLVNQLNAVFENLIAVAP